MIPHQLRLFRDRLTPTWLEGITRGRAAYRLGGRVKPKGADQGVPRYKHMPELCPLGDFDALKLHLRPANAPHGSNRDRRPWSTKAVLTVATMSGGGGHGFDSYLNLPGLHFPGVCRESAQFSPLLEKCF